MSSAEQRRHARAIANHVLTSGALLSARRVGGYWANDGEPNLWPLLLALAARGKIITLPVLGLSGQMTFRRYRPGESLFSNRFGIPEPAGTARAVDGRALDLVFVPLVTFDDGGRRLGMGAGYYDRYLGAIPRGLRPRLVGVAHEVQRSPEPLPAEPWDVTLDCVVTERGWQDFR